MLITIGNTYRISLALFILIGLLGTEGRALPDSVSKRTVLLFIIDGLQADAASVSMTNGAVNLKYFYENGVRADEAYCSSPSGKLYLPDNSMPWGTAAPPNVAMHTGTHIFESRQMDDVFRAARRSNIVSLFSGNAENYSVFNTADYLFARSSTDSIVIDFAIGHLRQHQARLLSLHLQETRRHWTGPEDKIKPDSRYQQYLLYVDRLLGRMISALKSEGVWDSTFVIISADHGMGMTEKSNHPASVISSWQTYLNMYGPGIKRGRSISYAETPDIAVLIAHLLRLSPLQGHTDPKISGVPKNVSGTLLTNIFEGNRNDIDHPMLIRKYLEKKNWHPSDDYAEYRNDMIVLLKEYFKAK